MSTGHFEWRIYWPRGDAYTTGIGSQEEAERILGHDRNSGLGDIQVRRVSAWETVSPSSPSSGLAKETE